MRICVLIPSYNEEQTIGGIVKEIKKMGLETIVVDDGSTDDTEKAASRNGALVMRNMKNMGKGASLKQGFEFIIKRTNFDAVIVMDGDGQHDPCDIQKFLSYANEKGTDVIVGNRMSHVKNMPFIRVITNRFMSLLLSFICGQRIPDTQCGFRLVKRNVIKRLELVLNNYDLESEMLIKASREKFRIRSIPVRTIYKDQPSRINPLTDTLRFAGLLFRTYFKRR